MPSNRPNVRRTAGIPPAALLLTALTLLLPCPASSWAGELAVAGLSSARMEAETDYLPRDIVFSPAGQPSEVTVVKVEVTGLPLPVEASFQPLAGDQGPGGVAALNPAERGDPAEVALRLDQETPSARLMLSGPARGLKILVDGADRVLLEKDGAYTLHRPACDGAPVPPAGKAVVQSGETQEGLVLALPPGAGESLVITAVPEGLEILAMPAGGEELALYLTAFRGDAILALENAPEGGPELSARAASTPVAVSEEGWSEPRNTGWEFFPDRGRILDPLLADPREARVRYAFMWDKEKEGFVDTSVGGDIGLLYKEFEDGTRLGLTARGMWAARFDTSSNSFDLMNTDYIGGAALAYQTGRDTFELFGYHQSSHLGDEITDRRERQPIDYGVEVVRFLWSRSWDNGFRFYTGPSIFAHALPDDLTGEVILQGGGEYVFPALWSLAYVALDVKVRSYNDWAANTSLQVGMDLGDPRVTRHRQRLFLEFFQGYSEMGQYYDDYDSYVMAGFAYEFR